jgi:hypothetical protein
MAWGLKNGLKGIRKGIKKGLRKLNPFKRKNGAKGVHDTLALSDEEFDDDDDNNVQEEEEEQESFSGISNQAVRSEDSRSQIFEPASVPPPAKRAAFATRSPPPEKRAAVATRIPRRDKPAPKTMPRKQTNRSPSDKSSPRPSPPQQNDQGQQSDSSSSHKGDDEEDEGSGPTPPVVQHDDVASALGMEASVEQDGQENLFLADMEETEEVIEEVIDPTTGELKKLPRTRKKINLLRPRVQNDPLDDTPISGPAPVIENENGGNNIGIITLVPIFLILTAIAAIIFALRRRRRRINNALHARAAAQPSTFYRAAAVVPLKAVVVEEKPIKLKRKAVNYGGRQCEEKNLVLRAPWVSINLEVNPKGSRCVERWPGSCA